MKNSKRNIILELIATLVLIAVMAVASNSNSYSAQPIRDWTYYKMPQPVRCTCYIEHGITASGIQTRNGIIAGRKEWLGMAAVLYEVKEDGTLEHSGFMLGEQDHRLMLKLAKAGTDHRKFMRMITVYTDITAPLYW